MSKEVERCASSCRWLGFPIFTSPIHMPKSHPHTPKLCLVASNFYKNIWDKNKFGVLQKNRLAVYQLVKLYIPSLVKNSFSSLGIITFPQKVLSEATNMHICLTYLCVVFI